MAFCVRALDNTFKIGHAFIGTGDPYLKQKLSKHVIHPSALDCSGLNYNQVTNEGVILCPGVSITCNVAIGKMVTLNLNVTVGHDVLIDDFTTVNPGAHISGNVKIGKRCLIGTGAVIKEGVTIADDTVIGAGSVVVKDILEPDMVHFGVPAVSRWVNEH
jgi:UDP-3-O-[3-hydroxymyristoyl] glucosamine N-acyltransferase